MTPLARRERPLRVVFLGHSAALSGAELGLVDLVGALEGVDPLVLLAEDGPLVDRFVAAGVPVELMLLRSTARGLHRGDVRLGGLRVVPAALAATAYSLRLSRRLRQLQPDLVQANTLKALVYGSVAAPLAGRPLIWHAHDRIADDYLPGPAIRLVLGAARHAAIGVIANSEATLETLGRLDLPTAVVHEPVSYDRFQAAAGRTQTGSFTVAMVGRIAPWKGQDVFIRAFASAFPAGEERAVIVGAPLFGEEDYRRSLVRLIDDLGLRRRVELRGFRADVAAELTGVDALVHASVIPEPFGRVVVEGMAAGLPVIAAADGGPREIITDGADGVLFPPGDVDALAVALARLAANRGLAHAMGQAAAARAREYSPQAAACRTGAFYRRLLDERRGAAR